MVKEWFVVYIRSSLKCILRTKYWAHQWRTTQNHLFLIMDKPYHQFTDWNNAYHYIYFTNSPLPTCTYPKPLCVINFWLSSKLSKLSTTFSLHYSSVQYFPFLVKNPFTSIDYSTISIILDRAQESRVPKLFLVH